VITRSVLFSLKLSRNRLAAGLGPDPLGELKRSTRPSSRIRGWDGTPGGVGEGEIGGEGREREERREEEKRGGRGRGEREGAP